MGITDEPAGIGTPASSVSRVATRVMVSTLGVPARREPVDQLVGDLRDQIVLSLRQRPLGEGLRDQGPVPTVLGLVHAEHDVLTEHVTEDSPRAA